MTQKNLGSVRVNSLRGNVEKHYRQWQIIKAQAMMVSLKNFTLVSLTVSIHFFFASSEDVFSRRATFQF